MASNYQNKGPIYLTQAEYDALATKVNGQEYIIYDTDGSTPVRCYTGTTAPTTSTACQNIGDKYIVNNTDIYECTNISGSTYTWTQMGGDVFVATYGTTTYAALVEAYNNNKVIMLSEYNDSALSSQYYTVLNYTVYSSAFHFLIQRITDGYMEVVKVNASGWSVSALGTPMFAPSKEVISQAAATITMDMYNGSEKVYYGITALTSLAINMNNAPSSYLYNGAVKIIFTAGSADVTPTKSGLGSSYIIGEDFPTVPAGKTCEMLFTPTYRYNHSPAGAWKHSCIIYD